MPRQFRLPSLASWMRFGKCYPAFAAATPSPAELCWPLVFRVLETAEERRENFDAVPEILETDVFVRGVLIVVVVRDWECDDGNIVALLEEIHRQAAARGR